MSLHLVNYRLIHEQETVSDGDDIDTEVHEILTGFWAGDFVVDLQRVASACSEVESDCGCEQCWENALNILTCPGCLKAVREYAAWFKKQNKTIQKNLGIKLDEAKLLSPIPHPGKVFCQIGRAHV